MVLQFFSKQAFRQHILRGQSPVAGVLSVSCLKHLTISLSWGCPTSFKFSQYVLQKAQVFGSFAFTANPEYPFWKLFVIQPTGVGLLLATQ